MVFLYQCQIKESGIHGRGLFACQDIPKGAVYWVFGDHPEPKIVIGFQGYQPQSNLLCTREDLQKMEKQNLPDLVRLLHGAIFIPNSENSVYLRDGNEFTNHSQDWNGHLLFDQIGHDHNKMTCVARKQIKKGDQITGYYGLCLSVENKWLKDLVAKYVPGKKEIQDKIQLTGNLGKNWEI